MSKRTLRALVEMGFILFLFYSNLLMGEFERSGRGERQGLVWALRDVVTPTNFAIGVGSALVGFGIVELLRKRLS